MASIASHTETVAKHGRDSHDGTGLSEIGRLSTLDGADDGPAPTWQHAPIVSSRALADRYHFLRLYAPTIASSTRPGQFVMLGAARLTDEDPVLPRPMAVFGTDTDAGTIDVISGVVGRGTRLLTTFEQGQQMLTVGPLGRGFRLSENTRHVLLVGRGIGTCSLTMLAPVAARRGLQVTAVVSGRHSAALIGSAEYRAAGVTRVVEVTDADGSSDVDTLQAALRRDLDACPPQQIFTCGSDRLARMCRALADRWDSEVQVSLEAHMACGIGYCHGCSSGQRTAEVEAPLVCVQGPVFLLEAQDQQ